MTNEQSPQVLPVNPAGIPDELKVRSQWVVWRFDPPEEAGKKWRKRPYNVRTGSLAKPNAPQTWAAYDAALAAYRCGGWSGIGYMFSANDPYCGIDIDGCRDPRTGTIDPQARRTIDELNSFAECSASGTGVHVIVRASLRGERNRTGIYELYDSGRYFTFTGHRLEGSPAGIEARQAETDALYARLFTEASPASEPAKQAHTMRAPEPMPAGKLTDEQVLEKARNAANGWKFSRLWDGDTSMHGGDDSGADLALVDLLAFYTQDPVQLDRLIRQSGLCREKWNSRRGDTTYLALTIRKALDGRTERWQPGGSSGAENPSLISPQPAAGMRRAEVVSLVDVEAEEIEWLWRGWLPAGMLAILGGYGGDGKSTLLASLIATFSRGGTLPDGTRAPVLNTLMLAAEDDPGRVIVPRLRLHMADVSRVACSREPSPKLARAGGSTSSGMWRRCARLSKRAISGWW